MTPVRARQRFVTFRWQSGPSAYTPRWGTQVGHLYSSWASRLLACGQCKPNAQKVNVICWGHEVKLPKKTLQPVLKPWVLKTCHQVCDYHRSSSSFPWIQRLSSSTTTPPPFISHVLPASQQRTHTHTDPGSIVCFYFILEIAADRVAQSRFITQSIDPAGEASCGRPQSAASGPSEVLPLAVGAVHHGRTRRGWSGTRNNLLHVHFTW